MATKLPSTSAIAFNLVGACVIVTVLAYSAYSFFNTPTVPPCSQRYHAARQFGLSDEAGRPLNIGQIESRLNWDRRGVAENVSIVRARLSSGAQPAAVLKVKLDEMSNDGGQSFGSGMSFFWEFGENVEAQAACLSYKVYFPSKFKFDSFGQLPGLVSKTKTSTWSSNESSRGFESNVAWSRSGMIGVLFSTADRPRPAQLDSSKSQNWPTGRWVDVEQEVVLNGDGQKNGLLRLWVDGQLQIDHYGLAFRSDGEKKLTGTSISVGYRTEVGEPAILGLSAPTVQTR